MRLRFIVLWFLCVSVVSAVPVVEFSSYDIRKGETVIASITVDGEFTRQIASSDVKFFDGRKEVFFDHEVFYYDGTHYLVVYASRVGNFSLRIAEVLYKESGILQSSTLDVPLVINDSKVFSSSLNASVDEVLSIRPGFWYASSIPKIKVTNMGGQSLNVSFLEQTVTFDALSSEEIVFTPASVFSFLNISSYKEFVVPIVYLSAGNNSFVAPVEVKLKANPSLVFGSVVVGESSSLFVELFNLGLENMTNLSLSANTSFLSFVVPENISAKEVVNLSLNVSFVRGGHYAGVMNLSYVQFNRSWLVELPYSFFVVPKGANTSEIFSSAPTCSVLGGVVCPDGYDCSTNPKFTKDGSYCCLSNCSVAVDPFVDADDGSGWIMGVVILLVLVAGGYFLYAKSKKAGPALPSAQLQKVSDDYAQRMNGSLTKN